MCRLAAFPPGMNRNDALDLVQDMLGQNKDGFGFGYLGDDGNFVIKKTELSLEDVLKKRSAKNFLDWPEDRWVLVHVRKASVGSVSYRNTHPFIINNQYIGCHNGSFKDHVLIKAAMPQSKYNSDTDSEIALKFLVKIGHRKFNKICSDNGVYLILNKQGELTAVKNTYQADLKIAFHPQNNQKFVISEMPYQSDYKDEEMDAGYIVFNKNGKIIRHQAKKTESNSYSVMPKTPFRQASEVLNQSFHSDLPHIYRQKMKLNNKPFVSVYGDRMENEFDV